MSDGESAAPGRPGATSSSASPPPPPPVASATPPGGAPDAPFPMFAELKAILRHSFLYGLANWVRPLLSFFLLPFYAHYISIELYGDLGLLVNTTEFVGLLIGMRFDLTVSRLYFERKDDASRQTVVFTAFAWLVALAALGTALGCLFAPQLVTVLFTWGASGDAGIDKAVYADHFRIAFLTLFFQLAAQVPSAYARILKKSAFFSAVTLLGLILGLTLNIAFVAGLELGIRGVLLSGLIVNAFLFAVLGLMMLRRVRPVIARKDLADLNAVSLPLLPGSLAVFFLTFGDQFIIQYLKGREDVGAYRGAYKFGLLVSYVITQPFMQFWRVRMYEIYERGRATKAYRKVLTLFTFLILYAALLLSVSIEDFFRIIPAEPNWALVAPLVPLLALAYVFAGIRYHVEVGIFLLKKTRYASYVTVSAAAMNVALNFALVPPLGAMGAAIATLVSFVYMVFLSYYFSNRLYHVNYEVGRIAKCFIAAFGLFTIALSVRIQSPIPSFVFRVLVASSYPFVLYFMRFYTRDEIERGKALVERLKRGAGGAPA